MKKRLLVLFLVGLATFALESSANADDGNASEVFLGAEQSSANSDFLDSDQNQDVEPFEFPAEPLGYGSPDDGSSGASSAVDEPSGEDPISGDLSSLENDRQNEELATIQQKLIDSIKIGGFSGGVSRNESGTKLALNVSTEALEYLKVAIPDEATWSKIDVDLTEGEATFEYDSWSGGLSLGGICTGGFPAYLANETGLLTAKHCVIDPATGQDLVIAYDGNIFQSIYVPSDNTDLVFVGLLDTPSGLVKVGASIYKPVIGQGNPTVGSSVCHWGIATGYSCATVYNLYNEYPLATGPSLKNVALMAGGTSAPGDSGGPWFRNSGTSIVALGVHLGTLTTGGVKYRVMTLVSAGVQLLGAAILLSGLA